MLEGYEIISAISLGENNLEQVLDYCEAID
jgi:hypothetical protein